MGLGSFVKKAVKKVGDFGKKVIKSGVGKIALGAITGGLRLPFTGMSEQSGSNSAFDLSGIFGGSQSSTGIWDTLKGLGSSAYDLYKKYEPAIDTAAQVAGTKYGYDLAYKGIQDQNASAYRIAQEANAMSQANAREQMQFQNQQSSTAHQREVADLRAAGLNPILSGTGGMGAASGGGASGTVVAAPVRSEGDAVSTAFQAMTAMANAFKTNADREFVQNVQTPYTKAQTTNVYQDSLLKKAQTSQSLATKKQIQEFTENLKKTGIGIDIQNKILNSNEEVAKQAARTARNQGKISQHEYGWIFDAIERLNKLR